MLAILAWFPVTNRRFNIKAPFEKAKHGYPPISGSPNIMVYTVDT